MWAAVRCVPVCCCCALPQRCCQLVACLPRLGQLNLAAQFSFELSRVGLKSQMQTTYTPTNDFATIYQTGRQVDVK